mmetsp:Transcript_35323/g.75275  ORF Transcript_35323/g.75275 Transcript_35323/m.75275 type:complete len:519 (+) Transcript_35323:114-1670(+)|eukprot:CAMPEP_0206425848 /NCGR_PEP_ID=MMETSP0324_2-20121206/4033_1 /ASSEMBLY_ACC=CAM_ASM_000836 /TAXON_ID=2866 /ORGANISM="Crypthecodinium cohnii, Strain Seligo" /LENGTH=518 /DNA_ID=CAMNT_0053890703 /DNA_START=31 /DNA_END=1587 /DNA_ORIENTATION=-
MAPSTWRIHGRDPTLWRFSLLNFVLAAGLLGLARSQIYNFENSKVPAAKTLHTLYAYYVYSYEESPERGTDRPFVKFSQLLAHPEATSEAAAKFAELAGVYEGFQMSIMRYRDFFQLVNPSKFCSNDDDVQNLLAGKKDQLMLHMQPGQSYRDVNVYTQTVPLLEVKKHDLTQSILESGVYILTLSNCGDFENATLTGDVAVKNSYGFLPGNEYHKIPFYGWMLVTYIVIGLLWMANSIRWWKELFMIQNCICIVILLGLAECFLWYIFYTNWNNTGRRGTFLFVLSILLTVVKTTFSYMLVLVASFGWGITRPYLDYKVIWKIQVLSFLYIVMDFIRETVMSFRHSHTLSVPFVLLCLLPVSLLNGVIFSWVFTVLSNMMESLKEKQQNEKLLLFQRLWKILLAALSVATLALLFQIFTLSKSLTSRWRYQWLLTDGVSHLLFLFVLMAMMYLWAPHQNSRRYAYSKQLDDDANEAEKAAPPSAAWEDDEDVEDDSFWAATKGNGPDETVIGASSKV